MDSLSNLDFASDFTYPLPPGFSRPVRQIKIRKGTAEELLLDTTQEGLCPFKARYVVKKMSDKLQDDNEGISITSEEPEIITVSQDKVDVDSADTLKDSLIQKLSSASDTLLESVIEIDTDKAKFVLRHFDMLVSMRASILAFIDSCRIKLIYQNDDEKLIDEEHENVKEEIVCQIIPVADKKDIIKLHPAQVFINKAAAILEIGNDFVKIEGFPIDVAAAKLDINKAIQVDVTIQEALEHEVALLLQNEKVAQYCKEELKQTVPNSKLAYWEVENGVLYVVGRNKSVAEKALSAIKNCFRTFTDDFSTLTLADTNYLAEFKTNITKQFEDGITINDDDQSKVIFTTTVHRFEETKIHIEQFKKKFTMETKTMKCSPEKSLYLQESHEAFKSNLFGGESICIEYGRKKEQVKVTAYNPVLSSIQAISVYGKTFGLRSTDVKDKLVAQKEETSKLCNQCRLQILDCQTTVEIKDESIEVQQVDAIVNSVSSDLTIDVDNEKSVTFSIAKAAGPEAQKSLKEKYPNGCKVGEVAIGKSGNLKCKELYHVVLERFTVAKKDVGIKNLQQVIERCLETANQSGYTSVAFPAVSAGVQGYPLEIVARTMLGCIVNYVYCRSETSIKTIIIAIPPSDQKVKKAFTDEIKKRKKMLTEQKEHLIEKPAWLCEWKVNVVAETKEGVEDYVKMINQTF